MARLMMFYVPSKTKAHVKYKFHCRITKDGNEIYFFNNNVTTKELYERAEAHFKQSQAKKNL